MPLFALALFLQSAEPVSCPGADTPSVDACASAELAAADAELNRYYQAAMRRLRSEGEAQTAKELVEAQRAWIRYRDAECASVYQNWIGGTIRTHMSITCHTRLTKLRTHVIWSHWLTYADSTPPILPRPDLASVLQDKAR